VRYRIKTGNLKSEPLTEQEIFSLENAVATFGSQRQAAEAFGVSLTVLNLVRARGTGHPNTIVKIREILPTRTIG
jgi:hypothetical protein